MTGETASSAVALLEELSAYRKGELLQALRESCPDARIDDLRFRIGPVTP